jgi:hypothetical protein
MRRCYSTLGRGRISTCTLATVRKNAKKNSGKKNGEKINELHIGACALIGIRVMTVNLRKENSNKPCELTINSEEKYCT